MNRVLIGLVAALLVEALWLVVLYNYVVNAQHAVVAAKNDMRQVQTESAELKDKVFALFTTHELETFASSHGLVQDRNPRYLEVQMVQTLAAR